MVTKGQRAGQPRVKRVGWSGLFDLILCQLCFGLIPFLGSATWTATGLPFLEYLLLLQTFLLLQGLISDSRWDFGF